MMRPTIFTPIKVMDHRTPARSPPAWPITASSVSHGWMGAVNSPPCRMPSPFLHLSPILACQYARAITASFAPHGCTDTQTITYSSASYGYTGASPSTPSPHHTVAQAPNQHRLLCTTRLHGLCMSTTTPHTPPIASSFSFFVR